MGQDFPLDNRNEETTQSPARQYEPLIHTRLTEFLGYPEFWYWQKADIGAWEGPMNDWLTHKPAIERWVKDKQVVVTAGGNQGMYSRFYSQMFEHVYVFEPDPLNFHVLCLNNQVDNVTKLNMALGAEVGFTHIVKQGANPAENSGMYQVGNPYTNQKQRIPMIALDDMYLSRVDLLQLDVENYEPEVLRGARRTIRDCRPVVMLEDPFDNYKLIMEDLKYKQVEQSSYDRIWIPNDSD